MKNGYYSFEDIKTKFKSYRELKESTITEEEYDMFCDEILALPKKIVDRAKNEIYFVLLSAARKKLTPACYINLKEMDRKKGIIVLTPFIFEAPYRDENNKIRKYDRLNQPCILHEVAHHILRHFRYEDQQDFKEKEKAAWEKAIKWAEQYRDWVKPEID